MTRESWVGVTTMGMLLVWFVTLVLFTVTPGPPPPGSFPVQPVTEGTP